jgi:hypothetical protein
MAERIECMTMLSAQERDPFVGNAVQPRSYVSVGTCQTSRVKEDVAPPPEIRTGPTQSVAGTGLPVPKGVREISS